ncbi:hypothetical protein [Paenibacillus sp. NPDC058071]|uniref:hypothetical protein n=1 Tax=Paenibacillus sp. NPDC058071 TaxID=3346326 RepID=UPI0036DDD686
MAMKLESWAWPMLQRYLKDAADRKIIGEEWAVKAQNKTMTASELAFINAVISGRERGLNL